MLRQGPVSLLAVLFAFAALATGAGAQTLSAGQRERATLELLARCRWSRPADRMRVPMPEFRSVDIEPARLRLGGLGFVPELDVVMDGRGRGLPDFTGLVQESGRARLTLLDGALVLRVQFRQWTPFRLGTRDAPRSWLPAEGPARELARAFVDLRIPLPPMQGGREIRIEGLRALLDDPSSDRQLRQLLEGVLLDRFRELGAAASPHWPSGQRGIEGLPARAAARGGGTLRHARPPRHTRDFVGDGRYGLYRSADGRRIELPAIPGDGEAERAHRALLRAFLGALRWPMDVPAGWQRYRRLDDLPGRFGMQTHEAFDVGSTLWHPELGFACTREGSSVAAPLQDAKPVTWKQRGSRAWTWSAQHAGYELRVLAALWHLDGHGRLEAATPDAALGGFRASEPRLRAVGLPKGCHAHLEFVGLFEGAPARRRLFLRQRVVPALWSAPPVPTRIELVRAPLQSRIHPELQRLVGELPELPLAAAGTEPGLFDLRRPAPLGEAWSRAEGGWRWEGGFGTGRVRLLLRPLQGRAEGRGLGVGRYRGSLELLGAVPTRLVPNASARTELGRALLGLLAGAAAH